MEEFADKQVDILGALIEGEDRQRIEEALSKLSPERRKLAEQVLMDKKRVAEIAAELGLTRRAVYYRLETIKKKLRKILKKI